MLRNEVRGVLLYSDDVENEIYVWYNSSMVDLNI